MADIPPPPPGFVPVDRPPPPAGFVPVPPVDRRTGAPPYVREAVGSAPAQDRLATLRRFYPDAQPEGSDNFVYTDPKSGDRVLYNEQNPSILWGFASTPTVGDIASIAREGMIGVGSTLGAVAGAFAGGVGAPVGAGMGAATTARLYDLLRGVRGLPDTRDLGQTMAETGTDFAGAAVGQRVGEVLPGAVRKGLTVAKNRVAGTTPAETQAAFQTLGITPTAGQVSGGRVLQGTEAALTKIPTSAGRMQSAFGQQLDDFGNALTSLADDYGGAPSTQQAGRVVMGRPQSAMGDATGVQGFRDRFTRRSDALYDRLRELIPPETPIKINNVKSTLSKQANEYADTPEILPMLENPALRGYLDKLLNASKSYIQRTQGDEAAAQFDAGLLDGVLPYKAISGIRSMIGRDLSEPRLVNDIPRSELMAVYKSLSRDLEAGAAAAGPDALQAFQRANTYYTAGLSRMDGILNKIAREADPTDVFRMVEKGTPRDLWQLRRSLQPEEWDAVAGQVLRRMGVASSGQQGMEEVFSPAKFMTELSELGKKNTLEPLLRGTRYAGLTNRLDALGVVAAAIKDTTSMGNPSGTAGQSFYIRALTEPLAFVGQGVGAGAAGSELGMSAAGSAAFATMTPYAAARLMTFPPFVNWLAQGTKVASAPNSITAHLGRLVGIAEASDPETRQAIQEYYGGVKSAMQGSLLTPPAAPSEQTPSALPAPSAASR